MSVSRSRRLAPSLVALVALATLAGVASRDAVAQGDVEPAEPILEASSTPPAPPAPVLSGSVPLDVTIPPGVDTPEAARPFFDTYSWQTFVALSWPAGARRGEPASPDDPGVFLAATAGGQPVVWGTYRPDYDLFASSGRPPAWDSPATGPDPCARAGDEADDPARRTFVRYSKGDSVLEETNQAFSYPLIDQNLDYALYEIAFNRAQYGFVRGADDDESTWLYLAANLAAREPISMPASRPPATEGALMVKAAWKVLDPETDDASRYYAVPARVLDPLSGHCFTATAGLVGLHLVQKLASFPEWIWSSFEQVDNVPGTGDPPPAGWSFNNGTATPATPNGWADRPPAKAPKLQPRAERQPVQVTRLNPIPDATQAVNADWQTAMGDTVWRHYQLVITQWPSTPLQFVTMEAGGVYPKDAGGAFPPFGATNTVMETYFQAQEDAAGAGGNSCMQCHYVAGQADFSWTLLRGAHG